MYRLAKPNEILSVDGFFGVHYFEFGKNFTHAPESHDFWEMVYVDAGKTVAITRGVGVELSQGQAIFHEPGEVHCHVSNHEAPSNLLVVLFRGGGETMPFFSQKTFTFDKSEKTILHLFLEEAANTAGMLSRQYSGDYTPDATDCLPGASQLMQCYFTELLIRLSRGDNMTRIRQSPEGVTIAQNSLVDLICDFLRENVTERITLTDLCARFFVGKTQLTDLFLRTRGQSPIHCFSEMKIGEAKRLLRETDLSVSEIADRLAFGSIHAFSRAFRQKVGFPPSEYRDAIN